MGNLTRATSLLGFACLVLVCAAQPRQPNHDPDAVHLVTSDIPNFWRVFDQASLSNAADLFQYEYLDRGTAGLQDFVKGRIQNARALAATVVARPRYYAAIRERTLALDQNPAVKQAIRRSFHHLKEIYPAAAFPDVYFVLGRMNSAGTVSPNGLLIGVEMNARDENTPVDELSAWEKAVIGQIDVLPNIVAHELIHIQQLPEGSKQPTLLEQSLREGGADFVGELISGDVINKMQRAYGDAHEQALWDEFQTRKSGTDLSSWLFQGDRAKDRPADLGYYVGYRICESFYQRAPNKREAVARILQITDADVFLRESSYHGNHKTP